MYFITTIYIHTHWSIYVVLLFTPFNMYTSDSRHDSKVMAVSLMEVGHHQKHDKCGFLPRHSCLISNKSGQEQIIRKSFTKNKPISVQFCQFFACEVFSVLPIIDIIFFQIILWTIYLTHDLRTRWPMRSPVFNIW